MFSTKCFFVLGLFFFCPRHGLFLPTNHGLFLPTNHTNLHESLSMNKMATWSVARIFTNSIFSAVLGIARTSSALRSLARKFNKFGCARHYFLRFSAALGKARTSSALRSLARKFVRLALPTRSPLITRTEKFVGKQTLQRWKVCTRNRSAANGL